MKQQVPLLTGDARTDRALMTLARLLYEIAASIPSATTATRGPPVGNTGKDTHAPAEEARTPDAAA